MSKDLRIYHEKAIVLAFNNNKLLNETITNYISQFDFDDTLSIDISLEILTNKQLLELFKLTFK